MTAPEDAVHRVGKPLDPAEARERAAQAAVLGDTLNLRVLSAIAAGVVGNQLAETLHISADRTQQALVALESASITQRDEDAGWTLTARAWVRFGRLLADVPGPGRPVQRGSVAVLPDAVTSVARDLSYRFASTFSSETVSRYVAESYLLLSQRARVRTHWQP